MHKNLSKRIILLGAACENSGNGQRDHMGAVDCGDISYCGTGVVCTLSFFSDTGINFLVVETLGKLMGTRPGA